MARLIAAGPISGENLAALPVKALGPAIAFYEAVLCFTLVRRDASTAVLKRDDVTIGLVVDPGHEPKRAGSFAMEADDLDLLHRELEERGGRPGEFGVDEWGGRSHRTFFLREDENGYCYCFHHPL
jgi:catechol 2,3-dioxygenase-like lactoylglutathione lyase family enzyme